MSRCQWEVGEKLEASDPDYYRCVKCGQALTNSGRESTEQVFARMPDCGERTRQREAWAKEYLARRSEIPEGGRGKRYLKAVARWVVAGRPERPADEVARIYDEVCRPCPEFDGERETCKVCGCRVRRDGKALLNKIAMATEDCPKGQW